MTFQRGDVVLVPFPFTDFSRQKARPAVVLSSLSSGGGPPDVILAAISSKVPAVPGDTEVVLRQSSHEFTNTGLRVSSVIKANKLVTIQESLIYRTLGRLDIQTLRELDERLSRALGLRELSEEIAACREAELREQELLDRVRQLHERLMMIESESQGKM